MGRRRHRRGPALTRNQRLALWIAFPLAGVVFAALRYHRSWFYFDEWLMLDRARGDWDGLFDGHQGHLEVQNYLVYRLQRSLFGIETRGLVYAGFAASVASLQVGVALVLRRLHVPDLLALTAAAVITFFGPGAQNSVFEFQQGLNFALALSLFAAWVALREERDDDGATIVAVLLLLAVACDNGLAAIGIVYVGVLLVFLWPWRLTLVALSLPTVASAAWYLFGNRPATVTTSASIAWDLIQHLVALALAGLVGGGERYLPGLPDRPPAYPLSTTETALLVAVVVAGCLIVGRRLLDRTSVVGLVAGLTAAVFGTLAIARERAWIVDPVKLPGSRYVQWIAVFLLLALLPPLVRVLTPATEPARRRALLGGVAALCVVFVVNLTSFHQFVRVDHRDGTVTERAVAQAVTVLAGACPDGRSLDTDVEITPLITAAMVQRALDDGALSPSFGEPAPSELRDSLCPADPP